MPPVIAVFTLSKASGLDLTLSAAWFWPPFFNNPHITVYALIPPLMVIFHLYQQFKVKGFLKYIINPETFISFQNVTPILLYGRKWVDEVCFHSIHRTEFPRST